MEPVTIDLTGGDEPTTTPKHLPIHENNVLLTIENMDSLTDIYVGTHSDCPVRTPAGCTREIMGDFSFLYYQIATGATWGASDRCYIMLERID